MERIQVGDIGTIIRVTIQDLQKDGTTPALDVSTATTQQFIFAKPSGATLTVTSTFTTDGTDGNVQYTTVSGDINESGNWRLQVKLIFPTGTWHTDIGTFRVHDNIL
jgi:hypothetical protein